MEKIEFLNEYGKLATARVGQKIILRSPIKNDFKKIRKVQHPEFGKEMRIGYVYKIYSPDVIFVQMLTSKVKRTDLILKGKTYCRSHYFVRIKAQDILNAKQEFLN